MKPLFDPMFSQVFSLKNPNITSVFEDAKPQTLINLNQELEVKSAKKIESKSNLNTFLVFS